MKPLCGKEQNGTSEEVRRRRFATTHWGLVLPAAIDLKPRDLTPGKRARFEVDASEEP